jgi:hypothetical protein
LSEQQPPEVTERDVERVLAALAGAARVFRLQVEEALPWVEVLAEDYPPAAVLLQSLAVAAARRPMYLGTVRHIEHSSLGILKDLSGR